MGTGKATLRIRRGEQTYGPMALEKADELLAKGRLQETDLVSENDGPWLPLKAWQGQRAKASADLPLFDDTPLFSGPAGFDPNYVPLSNPDVPANDGKGKASAPVRQANPEKPRAAVPPAGAQTLEGSGELKADDEPAMKRSKAVPAARPTSGAMKAGPSSGGMKARPSSASIPAAPSVDESGLDALLQSLAENERKAPPVAPGRTLPPRGKKP